ncbi:MAG TPA: STAS domain-containing protein [Candidatus Acidoferrum sp.]
MILEFTKRTVQRGVTALAMQGSIHCGPECARLEREVDAMIAARETRVIFDMAGVTHADSAAIGAIVRCLTKLKSAGGGLRIAAAQPMIDHSLKLTKVDKVIEIFSTVDQAAQGFSGPEASAGQRA